MTSESATDAMNNSNKRVRFEEPSPMPSNSPSTTVQATNQSPKGVALTSVRTSVMSLRKHLSPIILKAGESHIDSLHKLLSKVRQFVKMEDDEEFIPRSARLVDFEFRTSKQVEDSPAFQAINAETITLVKEFRLALKSKIMATLKIEIELLKTELYEKLMKGINTCINAHLISEQSRSNIHDIISTIYNEHFEDMLGHTDLDLDEFNKHYKTAFNLNVFPTNSTTLVMPGEDTDATTTPPISVQLQKITESSKRLLYSTFTLPGILYFQRSTAIEIEISLKKLHTTDTIEEATIDTATRLTNETSIDTDILENLIAKAVAAQTKKLRSELGQLKKNSISARKHNAKEDAKGTKPAKTTKAVNIKRGQKPTGASSTKKKSSKVQKPAQKAAAAANVSSKDKRKPKGNGNKKRNGRK